MRVLCALLLGAAALLGDGRESYSITCVRCHGEDGASENYPGIKRLDGIGRRLDSAQIRERMNPVPLGTDRWSVRSHVFTEKQLRELVAYVASLPPAGTEAAGDRRMSGLPLKVGRVSFTGYAAAADCCAVGAARLPLAPCGDWRDCAEATQRRR